MATTRTDLMRAGMLLGVGLGGFVDGILLHQILQWHNMLSARLPPVDLVTAKVNMLWDGLFHAAVWIVTLCGIFLLWRTASRADVRGMGRMLSGAMLLGWALFNGVEGLIDHHWLGLHHVRDFVLDKSRWDWGFLALSAVIGLIGWRLSRTSPEPPRPREHPNTSAPY